MSEDPSFEILWQLWRKHARKTDGRGKARPTYLKWLQSGADPDDILDGARYHIRTMQEKDRPYINLLSVYLNSERWKDECVDEREFQARIEAAKSPDNVVSIKPQLPEHHFSRQWERRESKA